MVGAIQEVAAAQLREEIARIMVLEKVPDLEPERLLGRRKRQIHRDIAS
jgi:hypothetical protein